jgi:hypothetical protein
MVIQGTSPRLTQNPCYAYVWRLISTKLDLEHKKKFKIAAMAKKDLIYSDQQSMFGAREIIGFGSDEFSVKEIDRNRANEIIIKNHYSGKITNHTYIHLGVYLKTQMLGVLQIGYAMNPASGGGIVEGTKSDEFCELNRMWLDDKLPRNSESMAISYAVRYIRSKYPKLRFLMFGPLLQHRQTR